MAGISSKQQFPARPERRLGSPMDQASPHNREKQRKKQYACYKKLFCDRRCQRCDRREVKIQPRRAGKLATTQLSWRAVPPSSAPMVGMARLIELPMNGARKEVVMTTASTDFSR